MKKILMGCLFVGLVLAGGLLLSSYAEQSKNSATDKQEKEDASGKTQTKQVQLENSWWELCRNRMTTMVYPESSGSILALEDYLSLSEEQVKNLKTIVEKANVEAKGILTDAQRKKLESVSESWQPQSMMEEMMDNWCPMASQRQETEKERGPARQENQKQRGWGCGWGR